MQKNIWLKLPSNIMSTNALRSIPLSFVIGLHSNKRDLKKRNWSKFFLYKLQASNLKMHSKFTIQHPTFTDLLCN